MGPCEEQHSGGDGGYAQAHNTGSLSPRLIYLMQLLNVRPVSSRGQGEPSVGYLSLWRMTGHLVANTPARGSNLSSLRMTNILDVGLSSLPEVSIPALPSTGLQSILFTHVEFHVRSSQIKGHGLQQRRYDDGDLPLGFTGPIICHITWKLLA